MAEKQIILVTGSNGQLGSELKELAPFYPDLEFVFLTRSQLPLSEPADIKKILSDYKPQFVINCAAYTAVDKAESEKDEAFTVNAKAVSELAQVCNDLGAGFIHISTDYVFDGTRQAP